MTLPVSSYEGLLGRVRSLTRDSLHLQNQINSSSDCDGIVNSPQNKSGQNTTWNLLSQFERNALDPSKHNLTPRPFNQDGLVWTKEQGAPPETKEQEETSNHHESEKNIKGVIARNSLCHSSIGLKQGGNSGIMCESSSGGGNLSYSFSGATGGGGGVGSITSSIEMGTKVEMVYNLLSMLGNNDRHEMTSTLLAMSSSPDNCMAMRHSGCLSLLVQLVHSTTESTLVKSRAAQALRNMVLSQTDDKRGRREARVLRLLDQLIAYCDLIQNNPLAHTEESHPGPAIAALMKLSFDEEHRLAMCQLGALYVIARLIQVEADYRMDCCITVKRYGGMALTNLTFGDGNNKALLCSMKPFMNALISQLNSSSEDLTQVTASVLRNLSWRADSGSKQALRDIGAVTALMKAAMTATKEPTMKSVLSALWNLSAHCNQNKIDICGVEGAIQYLVEMLSYQSASKTFAVVENAGGILRNISSHIAIREDYRKVLRDANCLVVLLRQLQSASLTVVSNACGTLWNLSARCPTDQRSLVALGAVPMLTSLAHSKHRMIAMGASAALKNLLPVRLQHHHQTASAGGVSLLARKKKALEAELNSSLSETCDNIEPGATWETESSHLTNSTPQTKDDCEQINRSMKEMTLEESSEQPVDYSLKYRETEVINTPVDNDSVSYNIKYTQEKDEKVYKNCFDSREVVGGESDYAETDLDQLTDYSLRYNEEIPSSRCHSISQEVTVEENRNSSQVIQTAELDTSPQKHDSGKGGGVVETPLMFSRCSSLGSLGSCEPTNNDCQSSVVSEFSRMNSGILSPSDVPDSPSQTIPPSPRSSQPQSIQVKGNEIEKCEVTGGVFDDTVVNFKEESTPVQFSTATSLSDLTILSDENNILDITGSGERKELELPVVSEEEDEDVLANCIKVGMQDNRDRVESAGQVRNIANVVGIPGRCGIPVKSTLVKHGGVQQVSNNNTSMRQPHQQLPQTHHSNNEERPVEFCTEGTPASLSHATSHSELSLLDPVSDDEHDNVLEQCIQSAMPQGANDKTNKKTNVRSCKPSIPVSSSGIKISVVKPRVIQPPQTRLKHPVISSLGQSDENQHQDPQMTGEDEVSVFATEGTPCNFSVRSSLSDLTINTRPNRSQAETPPVEHSSPLSSLDPDLSVDDVDEGVEESVTVLSGTSADADEVTLREQEDQALLMQVISSGKTSVSDKRTDNSWPDDTTISCHSFPSQRDGLVELESGGVGLISHIDLESIEPPSNMASVTSLGDSLGPCSLGITSLDAIEPPSLLDMELSTTSTQHTMFIDQIKPPPDMDELLDLDDSIASCASLTSELAEESKHSSLNHQTVNEPLMNHSGGVMQQGTTVNFVYSGPISNHGFQLSSLNYTGLNNSSLDHHSINQPLSLDHSINNETRFNTFVVKERRDSASSVDKTDEDKQINNSKPRERLTKQRRQLDRDRFLTRTIHEPFHDIQRLCSVESEEGYNVTSSVHSVESESTSENTESDPPRPVVVKPPEVKTIRGGVKSSIPVVRSPVKTGNNNKKKQGQSPGSLQRQGTFTKEEPSSSIPIPVKKISTTAPNTVKRTPHNGIGGMGRGRASSLPSKSPGTGGVRLSSSNQSLKSSSERQNTSSGGQQQQRWHSNTNLNRPSNSPSPTSGQNSVQPTSRIASLWKRVDESKKKQVVSKDTRVWIPPDPQR